MTFVQPSDPDYVEAKRIRQGLASRNPLHDRFFERFHRRFGVQPLTISFDAVADSRRERLTPRLAVVLERSDEYRSFVSGSRGYDRGKQEETAILLVESVRGSDLRAAFGLQPESPSAELRPDEIFVCFEDFERVARWEVHELVTPVERALFERGLGIEDQFWCTQRFAGPPIVFVHTDDQARAIEASTLPAQWADTYFELARPHDEFGFLGPRDIAIRVDSRQTFETKYSGNWHYYFK